MGILTPEMIGDVVAMHRSTRFVRSGLYPYVGTCVKEILAAFAAAPPSEPRTVRIILPMLNNRDLAVRAQLARLNIQEVIKTLSKWHEEIAVAGQDLKHGHQLLLRLTDQPHRYHAIFSEAGGYFGPAWHYHAAMATNSVELKPNDPFSDLILRELVQDFEKVWEHATPYKPGENSKMTETAIKLASSIKIDPILRGFNNRLPRVISIMRYINRQFPSDEDHGATKTDLAMQFGTNANDLNKRMNEMEKAGLLYKVSGADGIQLHGRRITTFGERCLQEYDKINPEHVPLG